MKQLLALLLCLVLTLTVLISCDDRSDTEPPVSPDSGSDPGTAVPTPKTAEEYLTLALAYMNANAAKCTTTKTISGLKEEVTVDVTYEKGDTVTSFSDPEGTVPETTIRNNTIYNLSTMKKLALDMDALDEQLQKVDFDTSYFAPFGYENVTIEKGDDGITIITGHGVEGRANELRKIFGALVDVVDPSSAKAMMFFDSEYRLIRYETSIGSDVIDYFSVTVAVYEYGSAYEPILPDESTFTTAATIVDLYTS